MPIWPYVAGSVVLDGGAALVAGLVREDWLRRAKRPLLAFATGVLLGTTFLDLLPEASVQLSPATALGLALGTLVVMLVLEWTMGHRPRPGARRTRVAGVLLGADALHNAADGAAIAAAFTVSLRLGVITALAVIVHEVPEEVADYVLLRDAGMPRTRALVVMTGVQLTAALGAALVLAGAQLWRDVSGAALAVAAGTFLHIAEVDLVPNIMGVADASRARAVVLLCLLSGVALVLIEKLW
jgi:zinc and cadmium transporter